jgi:hypothetical protein
VTGYPPKLCPQIARRNVHWLAMYCQVGVSDAVQNFGAVMAGACSPWERPTTADYLSLSNKLRPESPGVNRTKPGI